MIKVLYLTLIAILTGCTVQVVDARLTREEVAVAFQQRDAAILDISKKLSEKVDKPSAPKEK